MTKKRSKKKNPPAAPPQASPEKAIEQLFSDLIKHNNQPGLAELLACESKRAIIENNRHLDPFVLAVRAKHPDLISFFQESQFSLKQTSDTGENYCPALIEAIKCSDEQALDVILALGVNVNSSDYRRQLPLQVAYNVYSLQRENSLYEADYDKSLLDESFRVFKKLIEKGSDPNIYNNKGYRLIHQIVLDKDSEALEFLLASCQNLKVNALTYGKMQNCLHLINESRIRRHQSPDSAAVNWTSSRHLMNTVNMKLARLLVDSGCSIDHTDYQSFETAAFRAVVTNYYDLVKFFVIEGVNTAARNRSGNDLLSRSIQLGRYRIARLLIAADSPVRVYSCVYKIPNIDEFKSTNRARWDGGADTDEDVYNEEILDNENFLQYSILRYEAFLAFLARYTREPRSLLDLSRLVVRSCLRKPISQGVRELRLPRGVEEILLLKDIENMIAME